MSETGRILREESFAIALSSVKLAKMLEIDQHEWILSKQLLRSGTSIGANIRESRFAQSTADFVSKLTIALKEAEETEYWLELLLAANMLAQAQYDDLYEKVDSLIAKLVNVVKTNKAKLNHIKRSDSKNSIT